MDFGLYFTIGFVFLALIAILRGFLKGRKFIWQYSLVRLITVIVSAVIAIIVSKLISVTLTDTLYTMLESNGLPEEVVQIANEIPSVLAVIKALVCILITPIIFYPVFFFVRIIVSIFSRILLKVLVKLTTKTQTEASEEENSNEAPNEDSDELEVSEVLEDSEEGALQTAAIEEDNEDAGEPKKPSKKERRRKKPYRAERPNPVGILLGIVCSLLVFIIYFAPITGTLDTLASVTEIISGVENEQLESAEPAFDIVDTSANNFVIKAMNACGGKLVYNQLTSAKAGNTTISLSKEIDVLGATLNLALSFTSDTTETPDAAAPQNTTAKTDAIKKFVSAFNESGMLPTILADFISSASNAWSNDQAFCGIESPFEESEGVAGDLLKDLLSSMKDSTADTIKEDVSTIANIAVAIIENDVISATAENPMGLLENESFVRSFLTEIVGNDRLSNLLSSVMDLCVDLMLNAIGTPENAEALYNSLLNDIVAAKTEAANENMSEDIQSVFDKHGVAITAESAASLASKLATLPSVTTESVKNLLSSFSLTLESDENLSVYMTEEVFGAKTVILTADKINANGEATDKEAEVNALVDLFTFIPEVMDTASTGEMNMTSLLPKLGKMFDKFAKTSFMGTDCIEKLIVALLQSPAFEGINLSKAAAASLADYINESAKGKTYEAVMGELVTMIDTITSASSSETLDTDSVKDILTNLTPTGAAALKNFVTPELITSCGFGESNSQAISDMITHTFDNLADAKNNGMTDEEYEKETAAVAEIVDIFSAVSTATSNRTEDGNGKIFGAESTVGLTTTEYVDKVTASQTVSDAVVKTVYGSGEDPAMDPLNSNFKFNNEEQDEFIDALQSKVDSAPDADKENTEKTVIAIAALMNLNVEVVNGEVIAIAPPEQAE